MAFWGKTKKGQKKICLSGAECGLDLQVTLKGQRETSWSDRNVLGLDCGGGSLSIRGYQNSELGTKMDELYCI